MYTHIHTHVHTYMYTHLCTYTQTYTRTCAYTHVHTSTHIHVHTYTHTLCAYTHMCTHSPSQTIRLPLSMQGWQPSDSLCCGAQRHSVWIETLRTSFLLMEHWGVWIPVWSLKATPMRDTFYFVQNAYSYVRLVCSIFLTSNEWLLSERSSEH